MINSTLCYIENNGCYLMMYRNKKKDDPNAGKWIGVGGKFEPGETADECVRREVLEETGYGAVQLDAGNNETTGLDVGTMETTKIDAGTMADRSCLEFQYRGLIHFRSDLWEDEEMYLYTANFADCTAALSADCSETLSADCSEIQPYIPACDEGTFRWIPKSEILCLRLWEGDKYFLKKLLADDSQESYPFEMTLRYEGDRIVEVTGGE